MRLDRYEILDEIASGGMATVHFGRSRGALGFSRVVAIKRLHPHLAKDAQFAAMLLDEATLASRIRHPNVASILDVVSEGGEIALVLEYVHGESLAELCALGAEQGRRMPLDVAVAVVSGALYGLHAAHEALGDGKPLGIVHRDVSPENVIVGADGGPRVVDFGIATAAVRVQTTRDGQLKGKLRYMAPEQLRGEEVTPAADVYSAGVVLWEVVTGRRLFSAKNEAALFGLVLEGVVQPPSEAAPGVSEALDRVVLRALSRRPEERFATARQMAESLQEALRPATPTSVGEHVLALAGERLSARARRVAEIESGAGTDSIPRSAQRRAAEDAPTRTAVGPVVTPADPAVVREVGAGGARTGRSVAAIAAVVLVAAALAIASALARAPSAGVAEPSELTAIAPPSTQPVASAASSHPPAPPLATSAAPVRTAAPATTRSPAGPPPPPSARPGCSPPWVEDETGFRRVKRECL